MIDRTDQEVSWTEAVDEQLRIGLGQWRPISAPKAGFWFLRHGRTALNLGGICQGHADIPLDDLGRQQAREAGARLKATKLRRVISSDLKRAYETAELAARESGAPSPEIDVRLRERSFGSHEGIATPAKAWLDQDSDGEPLEDFARRILGSIEAAVDGPDVLVSSHGGSLRVLAAGLGVRLDPWCYENAVPLRFDLSVNGWRWSALR